jgi:hypothetical protein
LILNRKYSILCSVTKRAKKAQKIFWETLLFFQNKVKGSGLSVIAGAKGVPKKSLNLFRVEPTGDFFVTPFAALPFRFIPNTL